MSLIQINNINKIYGVGVNAASILNNLSLSIEQGEFVSITGASGSGKSTLLNIMGLLDTADNGSYMLNGVPVEGMSDTELTKYRLLNTGFIFQSFNLVQTSTIEDNITLPLIYNGVSSKTQRQSQCNQILEAMGISGTGDRLPSELSGGQQQRVAIARALINNPKVVFADEPTGNLDTESGKAVMQIIHQLHAAGTTIVMVTHDPGIAKQAQRSIVVRDGSVVADPSLYPAYQIYAPMPQSIPASMQQPQMPQPVFQAQQSPQPQFFPAVPQQPMQPMQPMQPQFQPTQQPVYQSQPGAILSSPIAQIPVSRPLQPPQYAPDPRLAQMPVADVRQQLYQPQIDQTAPPQPIVPQQATKQPDLSPASPQPLQQPMPVDGISNEALSQQVQVISDSSVVSDAQAVSQATLNQQQEADNATNGASQAIVEPQVPAGQLATSGDQPKEEAAPKGAVFGANDIAPSPSTNEVSTQQLSTQNNEVLIQPVITSQVFDVQQGLEG